MQIGGQEPESQAAASAGRTDAADDAALVRSVCLLCKLCGCKVICIFGIGTHAKVLDNTVISCMRIPLYSTK